MKTNSDIVLRKKLKKCDGLIGRGKYSEVLNIIKEYPELNNFSYEDNSLILSCYPDHLEFLRDLIKNGLNPDIKDTCNGTWLMSFSSMGIEKLVKFFLDNGAAVNARTKLNETAFSFACAANEFKCAILLRSYGADINNISGECATPLDWISEDSKDFIEWMRINGAKKFIEL